MAETKSEHARNLLAWGGRCTVARTVALALVVGLSACSARPGLRANGSDQGAQRWPPAPLTARIEYVGALADESDLGRKTAFSDTLNTFITGQVSREDRLVQPMDVAVSNDGRRIFVSDLAANKVYVFDLDHRSMEQLGGDQRVWARPFGLSVDEADNLYVVEQENKTVTMVNPDGEIVWQFTSRSLERPTDLAVDRKRGRIYVVDGSRQKSANHLVHVFDLKGRLIGSMGKGKGSEAGFLLFPTYVTLAPDGKVYVTDTLNSRIAVFDPSGAFIRNIGERGNLLGSFDKPKGVALDHNGDLYVADSGWSNVQIFNSRGQVIMFFSRRGSQAGEMRNPTGLSIDRDGNIYVADYLNNRVAIYRIITDPL